MEPTTQKKTRRKAVVKTETTGFKITPTVSTPGETHFLQELVDSGNAPIMIATGVTCLDAGKSRKWVSYKVKFQADKVLEIEVSEPMNQLEAGMSAKIEFQTLIEDTFS